MRAKVRGLGSTRGADTYRSFLRISVLGTANFLGLYLGAGIISSLVSLAWHRAANRGRRTTHGSEGASGAIYACLSFFAATFPQTQFLMFFVIPMPAWVAVGGIFAVSRQLVVEKNNED